MQRREERFRVASGGRVSMRRIANHREHGEHRGRFRIASGGPAKVRSKF